MSKKLDFHVEDGVFHFGIDPNEDGEKVVSLKLHMNEAFQEAMARGDAIEGAKVVSFKFNGTKLELVLDTDKDGEPLLGLTVDLAEGFDEIQDAVAAKKNS